ncbi:transcriptional regulator [Nonomuraea sp. NPDC047529]|uniref:transcriptional regulator n=1 Tax=Nonomuraea sp. NPDC047529 TaxID=3155623 RepID=UPI0033D30C41
MDPLFDEFLHVPARLSVVALPAPAERGDFDFIRNSVGTSDSALSKQVSALAAAGHVVVRRGQDKRARRTYVQLAPRGRSAFQRHAAALERIVALARDSADRPAADQQ